MHTPWALVQYKHECRLTPVRHAIKYYIIFNLHCIHDGRHIRKGNLSWGLTKGVTCTHQSRNSVEITFDCHRELEQVWSCQVPQVLAAALRSHRLVYTCTRCVGCRWLATYTTLVDSILGTPGGWVCSLQLLDDQCRPVAGPLDTVSAGVHVLSVKQNRDSNLPRISLCTYYISKTSCC